MSSDSSSTESSSWAGRAGSAVGSGFSSAGSWIKGKQGSYTEGTIPGSIKFVVCVTFLFSFIWMLVYFIQLGEGKASGAKTSTSDDETKGTCGDKCTISLTKVLKDAFLPPFICCVVGVVVGLFLYYFLVEKKARQLIGARAAVSRHSSSSVRSLLIFLVIAFVLWMGVSFGFYALMSQGNIQFFKEKEYKDLNTKTACTGAGHHWCKKNGVAPNTFWFFLLSLSLFFIALVVGVVKYMRRLTPEDEFCKKVNSIGRTQASRYKTFAMAEYQKTGAFPNPPDTVNDLLVSNLSGDDDETDLNTRMAIANELKAQRDQDPSRCANVFNKLDALVQKFHVKKDYNEWKVGHGGSVGMKRVVTFSDAGRAAPQRGTVYTGGRQGGPVVAGSGIQMTHMSYGSPDASAASAPPPVATPGLRRNNPPGLSGSPQGGSAGVPALGGDASFHGGNDSAVTEAHVPAESVRVAEVAANNP